MKRLVLAVPLLVILLSCSSGSTSPYVFLKSKTEDTDRMDLYAYSGAIDVNQLKELCSTRKAKLQSGVFYFLVLFDDKENAVFPSSPFTAEYGIEEVPLSHIRALYTFNRLNGFSELKVYESNAWESRPTVIKVE